MSWLMLLITGICLQARASGPHIKAAVEAFENGKAAQAKKQFDSAAGLFQQAIDIEPTFIDARKALIRVDLDAGHRMDSAKAITQLLEIEPDDTVDRVLLGQFLLEQQQPERALAQFSAALNLEAYNADALLGFATAAARIGMADRAKEALERGRKRYPSDPRFQTPAKQNN
jgi:tetratricopeptide (TPR) repeat protein